jgi:hypothetical protein
MSHPDQEAFLSPDAPGISGTFLFTIYRIGLIYTSFFVVIIGCIPE